LVCLLLLADLQHWAGLWGEFTKAHGLSPCVKYLRKKTYSSCSEPGVAGSAR